MPKLPKDGTHTLQTRYTEEVVKLKRKQNVVREMFGRDFVGEPRAGAVKFTKRPNEVKVLDYDVVNGVTLETSTTDYITVPIDNNIAINELIDGYEASAVPDNLVAQRIDSGAYSLGRAQELNAIQVLEQDGTVHPDDGTDDELSADDTYASILETIKEMKKLGVDINALRVIISPDTELKLLTDKKYSNTAANIGHEKIQEGISGRIGGVDVYVSPNLQEGDPTEGSQGDDVRKTTEYIVFGVSWAQTAEDWAVEPMINDLMNGQHIGASALQGRMVYKDVLLDETTCVVKKFEETE